jgi:hypothetical protein
MGVMWLMLGAVVLTVAAAWMIFAKAGESGWKSLVPVLGALVMLRITGRPWWWLLLLLVPVVNFYPAIVMCWDLARVFGKSHGYAIGLLLLPPVFMCMLAFGDARYQGPSRTQVRVPQARAA